MSTFHVQGLRELEMKLRELPDKVAKKHVRRAVAAGGRIIRDRAKQLVRVKHDIGGIAAVGEVKKSIRVSTNTKPSQGTATAKVSLKGKTANAVGRWLEYGTESHEIAVRKKKVLSNERVFFGKATEHPGIAPAPFLRPAADATKTQAVDAVKQVLTDAVLDETKK